MCYINYSIGPMVVSPTHLDIDSTNPKQWTHNIIAHQDLTSVARPICVKPFFLWAYMEQHAKSKIYDSDRTLLPDEKKIKFASASLLSFFFSTTQANYEGFFLLFFSFMCCLNHCSINQNGQFNRESDLKPVLQKPRTSPFPVL